MHNFLVGDAGVAVYNGCIDDLFDLHKTLFKNTDDEVHILLGNIKNGKAGGVHHKSAIDSGSARVRPGTTKSKPNQHGVYEAHIDIKDASGNYIPKTEVSTFFPDSWSEMQTLENIQHAWENSTKVVGSTNI